MGKKVIITNKWEDEYKTHLILNDEQIRLLEFLETEDFLDDDVKIEYLYEEEIEWKDLT